MYSAQNVAIQILAAKILQLDLALADYGPEAAAGRAQLRQDVAKTINLVWNANESDTGLPRREIRMLRSTRRGLETRPWQPD